MGTWAAQGVWLVRGLMELCGRCRSLVWAGHPVSLGVAPSAPQLVGEETEGERGPPLRPQS